MKFNLEIDVSGAECSRYEPQFSSYGTIIAIGNTLNELLDNATVDVIDQDGGELSIVPADELWMQKLVIKEWDAEKK